MGCDEERLRTIMLAAIADETGIAGVPLALVKQRIKEQSQNQGMECDDSLIQSVIDEALNEWVIDKTLDELSYERMRELDIPETSGFIWHLKVLAEQKRNFYMSLRPEEKALIGLLRNQNREGHFGEMPKHEAIRILEEQGFSNHLEHIHVEDTIDDFMTRWDDTPNLWCYGLVKEFEKTEEYKKWQEEMLEQATEKEARRYRMGEEFEITDPIYAHLDMLSEKREIDLEELDRKRRKMSKEEYLLKKAVIETRDEEEEKRWNAIMDTVYSLNFKDLIALQKLFLGKELPSLDEVEKFISTLTKKD
jgi:hypothetical protein